MAINNFSDTRRRQSDIDFTPFDDDGFRTWKQNKAIVRAQLNAEAARIKAKKAAALIPPSDVAKRTANWWHKIIQDGYMRRGILRHKNGRVLAKQAMAKILGCSVDTVKRIIRELIEKGYMVKETNGNGTYYRMVLELEPPKQASDLTEAGWENWMAEFEKERQEILANLTPQQRKTAERLL